MWPGADSSLHGTSTVGGREILGTAKANPLTQGHTRWGLPTAPVPENLWPILRNINTSFSKAGLCSGYVFFKLLDGIGFCTLLKSRDKR